MYMDSILIIIAINIVLIAVLPSEDGNIVHKWIKKIFWAFITLVILCFSYIEYVEQMEYNSCH